MDNWIRPSRSGPGAGLLVEAREQVRMVEGVEAEQAQPVADHGNDVAPAVWVSPPVGQSRPWVAPWMLSRISGTKSAEPSPPTRSKVRVITP